MVRYCNIRSCCVILVLFLFPLSGFAQKGDREGAKRSQATSPTVRLIGQFPVQAGTLHDESQHRDEGLPHNYCGTDFSSPEARIALEALYLARKNGTLVRARKSAVVPEIGDRRDFRILDQYGMPGEKWLAKEFKLIDKEPGQYYLWVDLDAEGFIDATDKAVLRRGLAEETPAGSVDPSKGIFENNLTYFGDPPDFDGDGHTDILLYDIADPGVGGFVTFEDFSPAAHDSVGNHADVLHVDALASSTYLAAVTAHEFTHLQHASSGWDLTLITEGIAEYAMILNGYLSRSIDYLNEKDEDATGSLVYDYTRPLFDWRFSPSNGGPNSRDYQKGGLFFTYIANQNGPETVGGMLQGQKKGVNGLDSVLVENGSSLDTIIRDFHTANIVNNPGVDVRFGYFRFGRSILRASPTRIINGESKYEGPEGDEHAYSEDNLPINTGAVRYIQLNNVANVDLIIDSANYQQIQVQEAREREREFQQGNLLVRVAGIRADGSSVVYDVNASAGSQQFKGRFSSLTLIVAHTASFNGKFRYEAYWKPLSQVPSAVEVDELPSSTLLHQNYPNPFNPTTTIAFELSRPADARLTIVDVLGRTIDIPVDGWISAGRHEIQLDATGWASGPYFYRLQAGDVTQTRSMLMLR